MTARITAGCGGPGFAQLIEVTLAELEPAGVGLHQPTPRLEPAIGRRLGSS